jgi:hypothetical protein
MDFLEEKYESTWTVRNIMIQVLAFLHHSGRPGFLRYEEVPQGDPKPVKPYTMVIPIDPGVLAPIIPTSLYFLFAMLPPFPHSSKCENHISSCADFGEQVSTPQRTEGLFLAFLSCRCESSCNTK